MLGILAYFIALLATVSGSKLKPNHALSKQQDIQIPQHCQKATVSGHGFIARFYELDPSIGPTVSYNFFNKNYRTTLQGTVSGVTKVDFLFKGVSDDPISGTIYGHDIIVNNFTLELSGFFRASASGIFTFKLQAIDSASFQIGTDQFCCNDAAERNTKLKNVLKHKDTFRLYKGSFYPFKIVMKNNCGDAKLSLTIVDPTGREITDFASNIFQLKFEKGECFTTITQAWEKPHISTETELKKLHEGPKKVYVRVPKQTIYVTKTWTKSYTQNSTETGALTDTVYIHLPVPVEPVTSFWDGDEASTSFEIKGPGFTDIAHVYIPKPVVDITTTRDGAEPRVFMKIEDERKLRVHEVPVPVEPVTSFWDGDEASTSFEIKGPGFTDLAVVYIPKPRISSTKTFVSVKSRGSTEVRKDVKLVVFVVPVPTKTLTYYCGGVSSSTTMIFNGPGKIDNVVVYVPNGGSNRDGYHKSGLLTRTEAKEIMNDHVASPGSVNPSPVAPNMDCVQQVLFTLGNKNSLYGNQSESASSMHGKEGKANVRSSLSFEGVFTLIFSLVNSDSIFHLRQNAAGWNVSTNSRTESRFAPVSDGSIENVMSASASCLKCTSLLVLRGSMSAKTEKLSFNNRCYSSRKNKHVADSPCTKDFVGSTLLSESDGPIDPIYKQLMFGSQHGFHTSLPTAPPQELLFSVGSDIQDDLSESYCFKSLCPKNNTEVFSHRTSEVKTRAYKMIETSQDSKKTKLVISTSSSFEQPKYLHMLIIEAETCKKSITLLILCIPLIIVLL